MRECKNHDLITDDLVRQREREAIEDCHASIDSLPPLRSGFRKPQRHREDRFDLIFKLGAQADLPGLVVIDLVVDLGDREPMNL